MSFDGHQQRKALTAIESAVGALGKGDADTARRAAGRAADLDQIGVYTAVPDAIDQILTHSEAGTTAPEELWDALGTAAGPGPGSAVVDQLRTARS